MIRVYSPQLPSLPSYKLPDNEQPPLANKKPASETVGEAVTATLQQTKRAITPPLISAEGFAQSAPLPAEITTAISNIKSDAQQALSAQSERLSFERAAALLSDD